MSINKENLPYSTIPLNNGGLKYTGHCAKPGCNNKIGIKAGKRLPSEVVISKMIAQGWRGQGFIGKGIPQKLICPDCQHKKSSVPEYANCVTDKSVPESVICNVILEQRYVNKPKNKFVSALKIPLALSNERLQTWARQQEKTYACLHFNIQGKLQLTISSRNIGRVLRTSKIMLGFSGGSSLFGNLGVQEVHLYGKVMLKIPFSLTFSSIHNEWIGKSDITKTELATLVKNSIIKKKETVTVKTEKPAIPIGKDSQEKTKKFTIEEGKILIDMLNEWTDWAKNNGWNVEIVSYKSRIKLILSV